MKRPTLKLPLAPKARARTMAQQGSDFTAEGAPPPGRVGTGVPVDEAATAAAEHGPPLGITPEVHPAR